MSGLSLASPLSDRDCFPSRVSGFFLLLATILGIATVYVSKPAEEELDIHVDKEIKILPTNEGDTGDALKEQEVFLCSTKESTELNVLNLNPD